MGVFEKSWYRNFSEKAHLWWLFSVFPWESLVCLVADFWGGINPWWFFLRIYPLDTSPIQRVSEAWPPQTVRFSSAVDIKILDTPIAGLELEYIQSFKDQKLSNNRSQEDVSSEWPVNLPTLTYPPPTEQRPNLRASRNMAGREKLLKPRWQWSKNGCILLVVQNIYLTKSVFWF